ncbi:hypothetical protein M441DRAFT_154665, partial [Trichoderma asperellum CBS 433.97]
KQRLSRLQKAHLVLWILLQEALGFTPMHYQVKKFTAQIIKAGGNNKPLRKV